MAQPAPTLPPASRKRRDGPPSLTIRTAYDQLAKQALHELLIPAGPVETEKEVSAEPQRIDVWFAPDAARTAHLRPLGLLGRIAARPCALEPFHSTPGPSRVATCVRKHVHLSHRLARPTNRVCPARTWILSSGRPSTVLRGYAYRPAPGWPAGIYVSPPLLHMGIVVINELPERRDTLLLRLMGAGPTLQRAIDELKALPEDALERRVMLPLLVRLRIEISTDPRRQTVKDKEFIMSTQDALALWEQRVREEVAESGLAAARSMLLRSYEHRFGPTPRAVRARVKATTDQELLVRWFDLLSTSSREEVDHVIGGLKRKPASARGKKSSTGTQNATALWEQRVMERGLVLARGMLLRLYELRFGPVPPPVRARVEAATDPEMITRWSDLISTGSREEVDQALAAG